MKILYFYHLFSVYLTMEEITFSSLSLSNNTLEDIEYPDNTTTLQDESSGSTDDQTHPAYMVYNIFLPVFIIFGSVGNILTIIIMRKGSLKDVSTCFYMSILAVADTGK